MPPGRNPAAHAISWWKPTDGAPAGVGLGVAGLPAPARRTPSAETATVSLRGGQASSGTGSVATFRDG